jgi:hypothetical protein
MKPYNIYRIGFAAVAAVCVMFVGCTYTLKSNDISILQTGSSLKSVRPKTFAFKEFKAVRRNPYEVSGVYKVDQPAAAVCAMVIRKELERNGHRCIAYSAQSNPDFIIEGSVSTYSVLVVGVKMTVTPVSPEKGMITKTYEGEVRGFYNAYTWKKKFNQSLLAMVKEMSTDPDLIAFLEK